MTDHMVWGDSILYFGDPINCEYPWGHPQKLDDYAGDLRGVGRKVGGAKESLDFLDQLPPPPPTMLPPTMLPTADPRMPIGSPAEPPQATLPGFPAPSGTGEDESLTLEAMRSRGIELNGVFTDLRTNIRGVAQAIEDYATALRTYRDQMELLLEYARRRRLDVRGDRIHPPIRQLPPGASQREVEAWEDDWRSYTACFEWVREIRADRRTAINEMKRALLEHAGVQPFDHDKRKEREDQRTDGDGKPHFGNGEVRRLRRLAAQAAEHALQARQAAEAASQRAREQAASAEAAAAELQRLRREGADAATLANQEAAVLTANAMARSAQDEAVDATRRATEATAEAQRLAGDHQEARDRRDGKPGARLTYSQV